MRLLRRLINFFSENRKYHHHHGRGRFHQKGYSRLQRHEEMHSSNTPIDGQTCTLCEKHCSLLSPKCKRGEAYAKEK